MSHTNILQDIKSLPQGDQLQALKSAQVHVNEMPVRLLFDIARAWQLAEKVEQSHPEDGMTWSVYGLGVWSRNR